MLPPNTSYQLGIFRILHMKSQNLHISNVAKKKTLVPVYDSENIKQLSESYTTYNLKTFCIVVTKKVD